jgi:hypothetical protein
MSDGTNHRNFNSREISKKYTGGKIEVDRRGCHAISRVNKRTFVLFSMKLPNPVLFVAFEKIDSQGKSPIHIIVTHSLLITC